MPVEGEYEPSAQAWVRDQVELYEGSGGTQGTTLRDTGLPVVIVTNVGASSGKVRKTPVMRVEHDGRYAMVASKGGAPAHPVWYYNVRANPRVELQDGPRKQDMIAREVSGDERAEWWKRAVAAFCYRFATTMGSAQARRQTGRPPPRRPSQSPSLR